MVSSYRQPTYEVPYQANVPPNGAGNALSDDFSNLRPQLSIDGTPQAGVAEMDAKWVQWDPGAIITLRGVDTRLGMAILRAGGEKKWCGAFQQLPLPTVDGQTLDLAIYARVLSAGTAIANNDGFDDVNFGLLLGENLLAEPDTSGFIVVGQTFSQFSDPPIMAGAVNANDCASYDGVTTPIGTMAEGPWPGVTYFRIRYRHTRVAVDSYTARFILEAGMYGLDYYPIGASEEIAFDAPLFASAGFALKPSSNLNSGVYCDLFRVVEQPFADASSYIGGMQQLGPV